jgi:peroxiredoxin
MSKLKIGETFPAASLQDIDGEIVKFPPIFEKAPATVVFFYRGRW